MVHARGWAQTTDEDARNTAREEWKLCQEGLVHSALYRLLIYGPSSTSTSNFSQPKRWTVPCFSTAVWIMDQHVLAVIFVQSDRHDLLPSRRSGGKQWAT